MLITDVWNDGNVFYFNWEPELMASLQKSLGPAAEKICTILSMLGEEYVMIAVFAVIYLWINKEAGRYTVHVLKAPEGFAADDTEYPAPAAPGRVTIVLK